MFQSALIFFAPPLLNDSGQVESRQVLKLVCVCLHIQFPLLECEEFNFPLMFGTIREVFLQESRPEGVLTYRFLSSLHQVLHPDLAIFNICHQQEGDER